MKFVYAVTLECETESQAVKVLSERLDRDESYGFNYTITSWVPLDSYADIEHMGLD